MILTLNCGSQSIALKVFDNKLKKLKDVAVNDLTEENYKKKLKQSLINIEEEFPEVKDVGHRVVHGGTGFQESTLIDDENLKELEKFNNWAPLHNPLNILGIKLAREIFENARQIAVFDTEFYSELPQEAKTYGLPEKFRKEGKFRRFGFHGISHEYAAKKAAEEIASFEDLKIISLHLGGGCSICAIDKGKAVDTSMGFTPLEGLIMMTRSGNVDPGIVLEIAREEGIEKADNILNKKSGMKGLTDTQSMLEVLEKIKKGDKKAEKALSLFVYRIKKYIGSYYAILGGCDLVCFTGSIGNGSEKIRSMVIDDLPFDLKIFPIKPNEELAIAKKVKNF